MIECHLYRRNGKIVGAGDGPGEPREGRTVEVFSSHQARETLAEVVAWRNKASDVLALERDAEEPKSEQAYTLQAREAEKWLAMHPIEDQMTPDAAMFPFLDMLVTECGCTAFEAATSISQAVAANVLERERQRVRRREQLRARATT